MQPDKTCGFGLPSAILGLLLATGIALAGFFVGDAVRDSRKADRFVTVKGLVERTVKSDLAVWPIRFTATGNDLSAAYEKSQSDLKAVLDFLTQQGFALEEIQVGQVRVIDLMAREYRQGTEGDRYIIDQTVTVRTGQIDKVGEVASRIGDLTQSGIVFGENPGISYKYTGLNAIKPEMLAEATRNAREAAGQFAADSNSNVGAIRRANQGVFSITSQDGPPPSGDFDPNADTSIMKKVRVVTTIDYFLEQQ